MNTTILCIVAIVLNPIQAKECAYQNGTFPKTKLVHSLRNQLIAFSGIDENACLSECYAREDCRGINWFEGRETCTDFKTCMLLSKLTGATENVNWTSYVWSSEGNFGSERRAYHSHENAKKSEFRMEHESYCYRECFEVDGCLAIDFNEVTGECWLLSKVTSPTQSPDWVSSFLPVTKLSQTRHSHNQSDLSFLSVDDQCFPAMCAYMCARSPTCVGIDYKFLVPKYKPPSCHLLTEMEIHSMDRYVHSYERKCVEHEQLRLLEDFPRPARQSLDAFTVGTIIGSVLFGTLGIIVGIYYRTRAEAEKDGGDSSSGEVNYHQERVVGMM